MLLLPWLSHPESPVEDLAKECRTIASEYAREQNVRLRNAMLSRSTYELTLRCMSHDLIDVALAFAVIDKRRAWLEIDDNPFRIVLAAIFSGERIRPSTSAFERIWKQLWHAFRHFVPPVFLDGFLLQCRAKDICSRAMEPGLEPGFEKWVTGNIAAYRCSDDAGYQFEHSWIMGYPVSIREQSDAILKKL